MHIQVRTLICTHIHTYIQHFKHKHRHTPTHTVSPVINECVLECWKNVFIYAFLDSYLISSYLIRSLFFLHQVTYFCVFMSQSPFTWRFIIDHSLTQRSVHNDFLKLHFFFLNSIFFTHVESNVSIYRQSLVLISFGIIYKFYFHFCIILWLHFFHHFHSSVRILSLYLPSPFSARIHPFLRILLLRATPSVPFHSPYTHTGIQHARIYGCSSLYESLSFFFLTFPVHT